MHILLSLDVTAHYYVFIDTKAIMHLILSLLKRHQCDPLPPAPVSAAKRQMAFCMSASTVESIFLVWGGGWGGAGSKV